MSQIIRIHGIPWGKTYQERYHAALQKNGSIIDSPDIDKNTFIDAKEMVKHYRSLNNKSQNIFISFIAQRVYEYVSQGNMQTIMFINDLYTLDKSIYRTLKPEVEKRGIRNLDMHVGQAIQDKLNIEEKRNIEYLKILEKCEPTFEKAKEIISEGKMIGYRFFGTTKDKDGTTYILRVTHTAGQSSILFISIWNSRVPKEVSSFNVRLLLKKQVSDDILLRKKFPKIYNALKDFQKKKRISY